MLKTIVRDSKKVKGFDSSINELITIAKDHGGEVYENVDESNIISILNNAFGGKL